MSAGQRAVGRALAQTMAGAVSGTFGPVAAPTRIIRILRHAAVGCPMGRRGGCVGAMFTDRRVPSMRDLYEVLGVP